MRESLTVLAILLIIVLTTALVGPYVVDWNQHRGEIEAKLSTFLGAKVSIAGPIDVKLLPRPIFQMQQLSVSGNSARDGMVSADRVDVELALTALLRGEIRFVEADLTKPRLTLHMAEDHSLVLPSLGGTNPERVSLGHVAIHDGTIVLAGDDGAAGQTLSGLDGDGEAESLVGPFKFDGRIDTPRGALRFRLATGAFMAGKLQLKTTLDPVARTPKTEIEGTLTTATTAKAGTRASFDGTVVAFGEVPMADAATALPWRITSRVHVQADQLLADDIELKAGAEGRALVATGQARYPADAAAAPQNRSLGIVLKASQIDVAKLGVSEGLGTEQSPPDQAGPPPSLVDDLAALRTFAENPDAFAAVPLPVALDFGVDTVSLGSQTFTALDANVTLAPGKPVSGTLSIEAPEGLKAKLDGSFEPGSAAVFKGRLVTSGRDLGRFAAGLAPDLPDLADQLKRMLPVKAFGFDGDIDLSGVGFAAQDVTLNLDRSKFNGTLTLTRAVGQDHARLFVDLTSRALDLDALPDWRSSAGGLADLDLDLTLAARAVRLARTDVGTVDAGRIVLQLTKTGPAVKLDRLSLADIGGATADLKGSSDGTTAHAEGRFDARRLGDLATLVQKLAPGPMTAMLAARADALSPALLQVAGDGFIQADGRLLPTALSIEGTAAGTRVALHLKPDSAPTHADDPLTPFRDARSPFTATLVLDAPESGALLRQIGLPTLRSTPIGHGRIEANARLSPSGTLDGTLTAALADTGLAFKGHGEGSQFSGHLSVKGPNLAPVLRAVTLATPETGAIWPVDAETDLTWRDGRFTTKGLAGHLIGARFGGDLSLQLPSGDVADTALVAPDAPQPPALTGSLTLDRLPLGALAGLALGPLPQPKVGAIWPDVPFGPGFLSLPRSELALTIAAFPLSDTIMAHDARLTLRLTPGVVTLADVGAGIGDGRIGGTWTLRRDGAAASLAGHVDWQGLPLATSSLGGRSAGALDVAGSGNTLAALISSFGGSGTLSLDDARIPHFDPAAIDRVIASADAAAGSIEDDAIVQDLGRELDKSALALGTVTAPLTVAAGAIRTDGVIAATPAVRTQTTGLLDLRNLTLAMRTTATMVTLPKDWSGAPPQVGLIWKGPFAAPPREVDAAALLSGLAARAIARDQARIQAFQDDIRERAFFASRLRTIEAEQQAARDRAKAEQDAAKQSPPSPLPRPPADPQRPPRGGVSQKPVDIQRGQQSLDLGLPPPPAVADPSSVGRY